MGGRHVKGAEEHAVAVAARAVGARARRVDGQLATDRKTNVAACRVFKVSGFSGSRKLELNGCFLVLDCQSRLGVA